jgi:hypothetical protein
VKTWSQMHFSSNLVRPKSDTTSDLSFTCLSCCDEGRITITFSFLEKLFSLCLKESTFSHLIF